MSLSQAAAYTLTTGRIFGTVAALLALAGVIIGGLALARNGNRGAIVALATGLAGMLIGGLVLAVADGGPGTGAGVVGAFAALVIGLIATVLGGLARARSRRTRSAATGVSSRV